LSLYHHAQDELVREYKILGAFHGLNFDDKTKPSKPIPSEDGSSIIPFRDPESYKHLSDEERTALTAKMLGPLFEWSKDPMGKKKL